MAKKEKSKAIMSMKIALDQKKTLELIDSLQAAIDFRQNNPKVDLVMYLQEPISIESKDGKLEVSFNNYEIE